MKEIRNIIAAYDKACAENRQTALATVVCVTGSAYRREGARMLVTDDGQLTGAISGGCLEGDALRKALHAMATGRTMLITYDTTEDDAKLGLGLGCNGIIHILIEPLNTAGDNPVNLLKEMIANRAAAVLVTLFSMDKHERQSGTCMMIKEPDTLMRTTGESEIPQQIIAAARQSLAGAKSRLQEYNNQLAFYEVIKPSLSLIIVGAGNDAIPLAQIGYTLGWTVTVADGRPAYCSATRFPTADELITGKPEHCFNQLTIDERTAVVLMTHNYNYDIQLMTRLMQLEFPYIGLLGPKKKLHRMLDELMDQGHHYTEAELSKLHGPTGLDIGALTPEEIALSIAAEIQSVMAGKRAGSLRERQLPIHA